MTREEAKEYAKGMTYRDAICNLIMARAIPYRKATFIKINELLDEIESTKHLPSAEKTVAQERYEDLCEYFGDAKDILKNREDFKAWLDRVKWHVRKVDELCRKYEQEPSAVKTGYWSGDCCSRCGRSRYNWISFDFPENDPNCYVKPFPKIWNYCPGCGSYNGGEQKKEEKQ